MYLSPRNENTVTCSPKLYSKRYKCQRNNSGKYRKKAQLWTEGSVWFLYHELSRLWDPHRSGTWGVQDEEATWGANQILGSQHRDRWRGPGWLNFRARSFFQGFPRPWSSNWSAAFGTGSRNSNREGGAGLPWRAFCLAILWLKIIFVYLVCLTCVL